MPKIQILKILREPATLCMETLSIPLKLSIFIFCFCFVLFYRNDSDEEVSSNDRYTSEEDSKRSVQPWGGGAELCKLYQNEPPPKKKKRKEKKNVCLPSPNQPHLLIFFFPFFTSFLSTNLPHKM